MADKVWIQPKDGWVSAWKQEASPSPIRTRREIVPGVYGRVKVRKQDDPHQALVNVVTSRGHDGTWAEMDAHELREAAHILNQIAEVLEENEG